MIRLQSNFPMLKQHCCARIILCGCPFGSVSCSHVHSLVAGHFGTRPVSTRGCLWWKSFSKSSKEKLLKSTWNSKCKHTLDVQLRFRLAETIPLTWGQHPFAKSSSLWDCPPQLTFTWHVKAELAMSNDEKKGDGEKPLNWAWCVTHLCLHFYG